MPKQAQLEQPPDYIEEAVKEILGRCLIGTLSFRLKHGYGIERPTDRLISFQDLLPFP